MWIEIYFLYRLKMVVWDQSSLIIWTRYILIFVHIFLEFEL